MSRRTKIMCTIGPATASPERIDALVGAGMDVARLNFSHGGHADHAATYRMVRDTAERTGHAVGVLADLQGPKIRLGCFDGGSAVWAPGQQVVITTEEILGTADRVCTTYLDLPGDVDRGDRLLVDDGRLVLQVVGVRGNDVRCTVLEGGQVSDHKGLSIPGVRVGVPVLSDKDATDLAFGLSLGVDLVALSFVRSAHDVRAVHEVMDAAGVRVPVIAKVERPEAVDELAEIVEAFDGLMVARGDLGVEMPLEQVPIVQKQAVGMCREAAKPCIVATQMLDSMMQNPRPTRAEASDVANAVLDGADAVMLSGETSVGRYPVEAVQTMARIVTTVDAGPFEVPALRHGPRTKGGAIARAAKDVGEVIGAGALVCFTQSGDTVRRLARLRSRLPLLAFTPEASVRRRLALTWGVRTFLVPPVGNTDEMVRQVQEVLLSRNLLGVGEQVVIVAGSPPGVPGSTNALRVWRLGDRLPRCADDTEDVDDNTAADTAADTVADTEVGGA
ncbi:MAG TPA: pyruvate kinase [Mycobacteriales bacterium]|nr:pyruvate kinase [Mycobacteriales bacterium]